MTHIGLAPCAVPGTHDTHTVLIPAGPGYVACRGHSMTCCMWHPEGPVQDTPPPMMDLALASACSSQFRSTLHAVPTLMVWDANCMQCPLQLIWNTRTMQHLPWPVWGRHRMQHGSPTSWNGCHEAWFWIRCCIQCNPGLVGASTMCGTVLDQP